MARNILLPSIATTVIALLITYWIKAKYVYRELSYRRYPKSMHDERRLLNYSSPSPTSAESACIHDIFNQCKHISYPSHSFVEVSRSSIPFFVLNSKRLGFTATGSWYEGYSEGYSSCSNMEADHELARCYDGVVMDTVPYGCWFYHAEGSGIYIDVGKTLIGTVASILEHFSLDSISECLQSYISQDNSIVVNCVDKYYCSRALALGYDSIQIVDRQEIIICSGMCASYRFDGACPPVRLYRRMHNAYEESSNDSSKIHGVKPSGHAAVAHCDGNGSSCRYEDCYCDNSSDVMNCDNGIYTFLYIHHGKSCEKIIISLRKASRL